MRAEYPAIDPQGRYGLGQAAQALGVSRMTIHRWRKAGLLSARLPKRGGHPIYLGKDLIRLWAAEV